MSANRTRSSNIQSADARATKWWLLRGLALMIGVYLCSSGYANNVIQGQSQELIVKYDNGDVMRISCNVERTKCRIRVSVFDHAYTFTMKDINAFMPVAVIFPEQTDLVRHSESNREFLFSFQYSCPEKVRRTNAASECFAMVRVKDGKIVSIEPLGLVPKYFPID